MKNTLTTLALFILAINTNAQNEKKTPIPQDIEFKTKFEQKFNEADVVFEADFDQADIREIYLEFDETKLKLDTNERRKGRQLRQLIAINSQYLKTDVVYKKPHTTTFKAGDVIDLVDTNNRNPYWSPKTKYDYGGAHANEPHNRNNYWRGRCIVFAKLSKVNTQYRIKYKDALSIEITQMFAVVDTEEVKKLRLKNWAEDKKINSNVDGYKNVPYMCFVEPFGPVYIEEGNCIKSKADFFAILKSTKDAIYERDPNYKTYNLLVEELKLNEIYTNGYFLNNNNQHITNTDSIENNIAAIKKNINTPLIIKQELKTNKNKNNIKKKNNGIGTITCDVANQAITTTNGNKYYEFDVVAKVTGFITPATPCYLDRVNISFLYDTLAFGSNIIYASNRFTTTNGTLFTTTNYNTNVVSPTKANDVNFVFYSFNNPGNTRALVPNNTPTVLFRAKFLLLSGTNQCKLSLSPTLQVSNAAFNVYTTTPTGNTTAANFASSVYSSNIPTFKLCNSKIIINPLPTKDFIAGNGDTLIITGSGFDSIPGIIQFTDANTGGIEIDTAKKLLNPLSKAFTDPLESFQIIYWSKKKIKVLVPSLINPVFGGRESVAARGPIKITNNSGNIKISNDTVLTNIVKVKYAIINVYNKDGNGKGIAPLKLHVAKISCDNGFVFYLDPKFKSQYWAKSVPVIEKALLDWKTYINTNVPGLSNFEFKLARDPAGNLIYTNLRTLNKISIGFVSNNAVMSTPSTEIEVYPINGFPKLEAYRPYVSIKINDLNKFDFDSAFTTTGNVAANTYDFYHNISHELGHVLGLDHLIGTKTSPTVPVTPAYKGDNHLMYFSQFRKTNTLLPDSNRVNVAKNSLEAKAGVNKILTLSKNKVFANSFVKTIGSSDTPLPDVYPSNALLCNSESYTLNSLSFSKNQWYKNGVIIPGATSQLLSITYPATGNPTLLYKTTQNYSAGIVYSQDVTINKQFSGCLIGPPPPPPNQRFKNITKQDTVLVNLTIYPNPSNGSFSIAELNNQEYTYQVINILGIVVMQGIINNDNTTVNFNTKEPNGIYTLALFNKETSEVLKTKIALQR
jgi:hypothetical protein